MKAEEDLFQGGKMSRGRKMRAVVLLQSDLRFAGVAALNGAQT